MTDAAALSQALRTRVDCGYAVGVIHGVKPFEVSSVSSRP